MSIFIKLYRKIETSPRAVVTGKFSFSRLQVRLPSWSRSRAHQSTWMMVFTRQAAKAKKAWLPSVIQGRIGDGVGMKT